MELSHSVNQIQLRIGLCYTKGLIIKTPLVLQLTAEQQTSSRTRVATGFKRFSKSKASCDIELLHVSPAMGPDQLHVFLEHCFPAHVPSHRPCALHVPHVRVYATGIKPE